MPLPTPAPGGGESITPRTPVTTSTSTGQTGIAGPNGGSGGLIQSNQTANGTPAGGTQTSAPTTGMGSGTSTTSGANGATQPTPATFTAPTVAAAYNPAAPTTSTVTPANIGTTQANAAQWSVTPEQLTSNQLAGILQSNSPLMQQASTAADQSMAARGLLNSSMTGGAEESSMIAAATPVAQANANTLAAAASQNTQNTQQTNLANASAENTTAQFNSQQGLTAATTNASNTLAAAQTYFNGQLQTAMQATGGQITLSQAALAANSAQQVADLQGKYSSLIDTNTAVSNAYNTLGTQIGAILANTNIANPQGAINTLVANFQQYAQSVDAVSSVNIASYFNPSGAGIAPVGGSQLSGGGQVNPSTGNSINSSAAQMSYSQWLQQNPSAAANQLNSYAAYRAAGGTGAA